MRKIVRFFINIISLLLIKIQNPNVKLGKNFRSELTVKFKGGNSITFGDNCVIRDYAILVPLNGFIKIGNNCSVGAFNYLDGSGGLDIGNDVRIGAHVCIYSANHTFEELNKPIRKQPLKFGKVEIENDVWIGANVNILAGVKIHKGSVIAAGSLVNKDVPPYSVVGGVPAKVLKKRV